MFSHESLVLGGGAGGLGGQNGHGAGGSSTSVVLPPPVSGAAKLARMRKLEERRVSTGPIANTLGKVEGGRERQLNSIDVETRQRMRKCGTNFLILSVPG